MIIGPAILNKDALRRDRGAYHCNAFGYARMEMYKTHEMLQRTHDSAMLKKPAKCQISIHVGAKSSTIKMHALSLSTAVLEAQEDGRDPKEVFAELTNGNNANFWEINFSAINIWQYLYQIAIEADKKRLSLPKKTFTTYDDIINVFRTSNKIVAIIGAGASVGPDFRSPGGLYDLISAANVLTDPYDVFDIHTYRENPKIFWRFAHLLFPSDNPEHSRVHYFLKSLVDNHKLLRLYTQNVDTLEIGIPDNILRCCHGSWRSSTCILCGYKYSMDFIRTYVSHKEPPHCIRCGGLIQPDIVFYGQSTNLNEQEVYADSEQADLLLVIGTSLKVSPVADIPLVLSNVPSILINRNSLRCQFNAELLGNCDSIIENLESKLGITKTQVESPIQAWPNKFLFKGAQNDVEFESSASNESMASSPVTVEYMI